MITAGSILSSGVCYGVAEFNLSHENLNLMAPLKDQHAFLDWLLQVS